MADNEAAPATEPDPTRSGVGTDAVPDSVRAAARVSPDQWIGLVDPTWRGDGPPPGWALIGEWWSDGGGEPTEFRENGEYRPSPLAHAWPEPTDPVDAAVQLSATGYGPPQDVLRALAAGPLAVALDGNGAIDVVELPDGRPAVRVFSSAAQVTAAGDPPYGAIRAAELAGLLPPGHWVLLNHGGPVAMRLSPDDLRAARSEEQPRPAGPAGGR
ncbi:type VII secretion system-associated protein [Streptomyces sp.]|uniref:type VII secretion system-associated protein n=1 Tax=Streptomyces sp. TaxID=1931 RepID=UPI002F41A589